jgi:molecular chaperone DnaK (HSP70)
MSSLDLCLGIDFGTTNSCLSVWHNNNAIIITDYDGSKTIPTIIEISNNKKVIGKEAYIRQNLFSNTSTPTFLVYEIKKLLGKKFSEIKNVESLAYTITKTNDGNDNIKIFNEIDNKFYFPEEIATQLFMSFKLRAELFLKSIIHEDGININNAVISVPAYYNKNQREIIKKCAEMANFNVLRLINEPTAAALCYGLSAGPSLSNKDKTKKIVVYDFGGGTLDISVVAISNDIYEVIETCGNSCLGGSDFDNCIMEYCITEFINNNNCNKKEFIENISESSLQKLKYVAEQAKITLTEFLIATIKIKNFYNNVDLNVSISREIFNTICNNLINLAISPLNDIFAGCNRHNLAEGAGGGAEGDGDVGAEGEGGEGAVGVGDIDEIIMVGGMTRVPIIRYNVERFFNKEVNCSIDPDNVVSIGAAIHGYMLTNKCNIADNLLLIDRTSLSIGLELAGGIMDVLIPRGTIIPFKKTRKYTTDTDNMESINIKIFEGERSLTKDNFLIGEFTLNGIEKAKRGIPEIMITFEIDANSIINIKAEDLNNVLNKKSVKITNNNKNLDEITKIIEIAKEMDEIDRIDKYKKMSYMQLKDNCLRIIESLNNDELKISKEKKDDIISNINEIYTWLCELTYEDIDMEKYKELLHDFKANYSLLMIMPSTDGNSAKGCDAEGEGVEILDDDVNNKKYSKHIIFIRDLLERYDLYNKQIFNKHVNELFRKVYDLANDLLIKFFIDIDIPVDDVVNNIKKIKTYSEEFESEYCKLNIELNILDRVIYKHKQVENTYLSLLDIHSNSTNNIESKNINNVLDILIDYDTIIYKMKNNYDVYDENKLILIEIELDKLQATNL